MWVLEALKEALIDHINLSFKISRACNEADAARKINDLAVIDEVFTRAINLHADYVDLMIYLRLLSTPNIVLSAERLHLSLDWLLDLTFSEQGGPGWPEAVHPRRATARSDRRGGEGIGRGKP
jgi:hypothetical protein